MKKKILFLFSSILLSFCALATDQRQVLIPFQSDTLERYGFKDSITNKTVIPAIFSRVYSFSDGLAAVSMGGSVEIDEEEEDVYFVGGLWGFINTEGKYVIPAKYYSATPFSNGTAIVGGSLEADSSVRYGLINTKGVFVVPMMYESINSRDIIAIE